MNIFIMYNIQKIYEERTDMLGLQLLAVFCSYSFRQGQEHKTSLQLMQLQFYGHVYRHLFLLDGNCCSCNFTAMCIGHLFLLDGTVVGWIFLFLTLLK